MAPSTTSAIGKKKRKREREHPQGACTLLSCIKVEKKENTEREPTGARCVHSSFSHLNFS
jgi:hypothetical protein